MGQFTAPPPHPLQPASLIVFWLTALLLGSSRQTGQLVAFTLCTIVLAAIFAPRHFSRLLRRSRWLLLTILVMFGWMTPGTPVPLLPGARLEGLLLALEYACRLLLALSTLAMLMHKLTPIQLISGMYSLLAPVARLRFPRDRLAVRLALTLDEVDSNRPLTTEPALAPTNKVTFQRSSFGPGDAALASLSLGLVILAVLT